MNPEEHLILRVPEDWLRELDPNSKLEIIPDNNSDEDPGRFFQIKLNTLESVGFLLDLPCIVETHKTLDYINCFKTSDISQLLYIVPEHEKTNPRAKKTSLSRMLIKGEKYKVKSGITPGTHNITSRFFKREVEENPEEVSKVEALIKNVMECGTARVVQEEIIELQEGENVPENYETTYDPKTLEDEEMDIDS
ncbi:unnamed protein product [Blepharisma stoltei]|uniref:TAFII55 protein conserved region domain-containing protein n=1 Tax=Blepharisma stoltei TaxID=1481888 RepID=A0AAU9IFS3_9CILI|nr:unnamed protein product [Blepharisma stoltei]